MKINYVKKHIISIIMALIIICCSILGFILIINKDNNIEIQVKDMHKIGAYNNPIIPKGFKKVETVDASWELINGIPKGWNNGLVIEDEIDNQFVWVPSVDITNEDLLNIYNIRIQDSKQKEEQIERYRKQISKYGGFYVARYEAGITDNMQKNIKEFSSSTNDIEGIPVSKQGQIVWNFISLKNAKINAQKMYNNENVTSDLILPIQWINIMQWVNNSGYNITNAEDWGNFSNVNFEFTGYYSTDYGTTYNYAENKLKSKYNMILSTGATERNKANNIYELAGNVREYTDGWVKGRGYNCVGGHFDNIGDCIYDLTLIGVNPLEKLGYRVVLYLK